MQLKQEHTSWIVQKQFKFNSDKEPHDNNHKAFQVLYIPTIGRQSEVQNLSTVKGTRSLHSVVGIEVMDVTEDDLEAPGKDDTCAADVSWNRPFKAHLSRDV